MGLLSNGSVVNVREGGNVIPIHEIASADFVSLAVTHRGVIAGVVKQSRRGGLVPTHCGCYYCFDIVWHLEI
ncbi:MAG: hypothetical protein J7L92_01690 [Dehalococcoidia bacterium]|nr:hypothetical protein [Dehalococcoidia bacterium]